LIFRIAKKSKQLLIFLTCPEHCTISKYDLSKNVIYVSSITVQQKHFERQVFISQNKNIGKLKEFLR